jgi:hypothetical protein
MRIQNSMAFDTFEGLPEAFGPFGKGSMAVALNL